MYIHTWQLGRTLTGTYEHTKSQSPVLRTIEGNPAETGHKSNKHLEYVLGRTKLSCFSSPTKSISKLNHEIGGIHAHFIPMKNYIAVTGV